MARGSVTVAGGEGSSIDSQIFETTSHCHDFGKTRNPSLHNKHSENEGKLLSVLSHRGRGCGLKTCLEPANQKHASSPPIIPKHVQTSQPRFSYGSQSPFTHGNLHPPHHRSHSFCPCGWLVAAARSRCIESFGHWNCPAATAIREVLPGARRNPKTSSVANSSKQAAHVSQHRL